MVVLLPASSNARAVRANTKHIARQSTRIFLMAGFSPFSKSRSQPQSARYGRDFYSHARQQLNATDRQSTSRTIPQRNLLIVTGRAEQSPHTACETSRRERLIFLPSDWPEAPDSPPASGR